jgi:hypothetical protein
MSFLPRPKTFLTLASVNRPGVPGYLTSSSAKGRSWIRAFLRQTSPHAPSSSDTASMKS